MSKTGAKQTPVVTFYSYKGGTGRTTAAANTAAALAVQGLKVVCLDLDLEGPGLAIVFGDESPKPHLQQYLLTGEGELSDMLIERTDDLRLTPGTKPGGLFYMPSSTDFRESIDYTDGRRMVREMEQLFSRIARECGPDLILVDAPSGYGELSALAMYLSSCLVVLFRYSRQHVLGTVRVAEFVKRFGLRHIPVASCVPTADTEGLKQGYLALLTSMLGAKPAPAEIRDSDELKWREHVLLFKDSSGHPILDDYRQLAQSITELVL